MNDRPPSEHEGAPYAPADREEAFAPPGAHGNNEAPGANFGVLDLLIVLAKHKRLVIGLPLAASLLAVVLVMFQPDIYTAKVKILPPQQSQTLAASALFANLMPFPMGGQPKNSGDIYVAMLRSRTVADKMIERFDLLKFYKTSYPTRARDALSGVTRVAVGKDGIISLEFDDRDPKRAAEVANAYVDELIKLTQVLAVTEASQRRLFFERQFAQAKDNLGRAEAAARQALANRGLVKVDEQGRAMVETTARLRAQITVKEVQIGAMRTFATEENAEYRMALRELEAMRRELAKLEGEESAGSGRTAVPGAQGMESIKMLRDVKYHEIVFELMAKQFEAAKMEEAKDSSVIQVLDQAVPPDVKSKPHRRLFVLMTGLIFLILAVIAAFVAEAYAWARTDPRQAERLNAFKRHLAWR